MVAIGVNEDGYREVVGCAEGFTESKGCWQDFFIVTEVARAAGRAHVRWRQSRRHGRLDRRGLPRRQIPALHRALLPQRAGQGPQVQVFPGAAMLKAIHTMESREASAAKVVRDGNAEALAYCAMSREHWRRIRTNNAIEQHNREIRHRTRVVDTFPDGKSALMLVAARLKHVADSEWRSRRYLDVSLLKEQSC